MAQPPLTQEELQEDGKRLEKILVGNESSESRERRLERLSNYLDRLFATALAPSLSTTHRVKAYNTLCGFIEVCVRCKDPLAGKVVHDRDVYRSILDLFIDRHDSARAKSMKQLLETFISLLQDEQNLPSVASRRGETLTRVLDIIFRNPNQKKAKPALTVLTSALTKKSIRFNHVIDAFRSLPLATAKTDDEAMSELLGHSLPWLDSSSVASSAANLIALILKDWQRLSSKPMGDALPIWIAPLFDFAATHKEAMPSIRSHLLPSLLKSGVEQYWQFLQYLGIHESLSNRTSAKHRQNTARSDPSSSLLSATLQVGVEQGLIAVTDRSHTTSVRLYESVIEISAEAIGHSLLTEASSESRLSGLSLLIVSPQTTRPLCQDALRCLRRHLPHVFSDTDPWFRGEALSLIQTLFDRLRAFLSPLRKLPQAVKKPSLTHSGGSPLEIFKGVGMPAVPYGCVEFHVSFVRWFYWFLNKMMHPSATYQNRSTASRAMLILARAGLDSRAPAHLLSKRAQNGLTWPFELPIMNKRSARILYDLLLDPFDDIRLNTQLLIEYTSPKEHTALNQCDSDLSFEEASQELSSLIENSDAKMLRSGRLDHADGVARALCVKAREQSLGSGGATSASLTDVLTRLIRSIQSGLDIAETSINHAVESHPVNSYFTGIRYILSMQNPLLPHSKTSVPLFSALLRISDTLLASAERCWLVVKPILCNDAPEGFTLDETDESMAMNTKDLLSYSWRSLKDSSMCLQTFAQCLSNPELAGLIDAHSLHHMLASIGHLSFLQLAELRHRGAFSTVAQTFATVCKVCQGSDIKETRAMVQEWYKKAINLIKQQSNAITRRSAGIPALIVGILVADPWDERFSDAINLLRSIALEPANNTEIANVDFPQVHAMNCLRAIFISTKLAERSDQQIVPTMQVATSCLASETWAIRNCGLMLMRSLVDRLLGSHESTEEAFSVSVDRSKLAYEKYPGLLDLLQSMLESLDQDYVPNAQRYSDSKEAIFPVLDLLRRAPPPAKSRMNFLKLTLSATESQEWHLRELASRTFMSCLTKRSDGIHALRLSLENKTRSQNALHGYLLCLRNICRALNVQSVSSIEGEHDMLDIVDLLRNISPLCFLRNANPLTSAVFIDIISSVGEYCIRSISRFCPDILQSYMFLCETLELNKDTAAPDMPLSVKSKLLNNVFYKILIARHVDKGIMSYDHILIGLTGTIAAEAIETASTVLECCDTITQTLFTTLIKMIWKASGTQNIGGRVLQCLSHAAEMLWSDMDSDSADLDSTLAAMNLDGVDFSSATMSPAQVEQSISMQGYILAARLRHSELEADIYPLIGKWGALIRTGLDEDNELSLRSACAQSLYGFRWVYNTKHPLPPWVDEILVFTLYDALNDDDNDIREMASATSGALLGAKHTGGGFPVRPVPTLASQALRSHLVRHHVASPTVISECLSRITGLCMDQVKSVRSFEGLLRAELDEADALFAVERQNLYIDDAEEARLWSRVAAQLNVGAVNSKTLQNFAAWCRDGLSALIKEVTARHDGPLGWTSKPSTFVLGMRLINACGTLLRWQTKSRNTGIKWSELMVLLRRAVDEGKKSGLHELWLQGLEDIMSKSVQERLSKVSTCLSTFPEAGS